MSDVEEKLAGTEHTYTLRQVREELARRSAALHRPTAEDTFIEGAPDPQLSFTLSSPLQQLELEAFCLIPERLGTRQKSSGSFYTQPQLSTLATADALDTWEEEQPPTICDPSCGGGSLLLAAARWLLKRWPAATVSKYLYGVDLNPIAVELTRWVIYLKDPLASTHQLVQNICCGNALLGIDFTAPPTSLSPLLSSTLPGDNSRVAAKHRRRLRQADGNTASTEWTIDAANTIWALPLLTKNSAQWLPDNRSFQAAKSDQLSATKKVQLSATATKWQLFHWSIQFPEIALHGGFDRIIANPPYVDASRMKRDQPRIRAVLALMYESTAGNWNLFVPFVERCFNLLNKHGSFSVIAPHSLAGADFCAKLHERIIPGLTCIRCFSDADLFSGARVPILILSAAIQPQKQCSFLLQKNPLEKPSKHERVTTKQLALLPSGHLSFPLLASPSWIALFSNSTLDSMGSFRDGSTTNEAYEIAALLEEWNDEHEQIKFINSGLIDPFTVTWGNKAISFLGYKGHSPALNSSTLRQHHPRQWQRAQRTTVAVQGLARRIEAVVAGPGMLASKSTVVIVPHEDIDPYSLCAYLNSPIVSQLYAACFGFQTLGNGSLRYGPRQLERLPAPSRHFLHPESEFSALARADDPDIELLNSRSSSALGLSVDTNN